MQKWKKVCIGLMLCAVSGVSAQTESYKSRAERYIEQFKQLAIEEQKRSGVPAAITLAQGIHETSAGMSELATNANNHFGIKCKKEWQGPTYTYTDDAPDECFRKYSRAYDSYKDHSDYLSASARYASLFQLPKTDYSGWATGLKRCGYATNPKYAQVLIKLVEEYNLQEYTYAAMKEDYNPYNDAQRASDRKANLAGEVVPEKDAPVMTSNSFEASAAPEYAQNGKKKKIQVSYGDEQQKKSFEASEPVVENAGPPEFDKVVKVNGVRAFYAKKGTVLLNDALKYNIRYAKLLELNDLPDGPLEADMYIYLDKKNPKGINPVHVVKEGESLTQIAQTEAIQLKYLKFYNHIGSNEEPVVGAVLQLQKYTEDKPQTYVKFVAPKEEPAFAGSNPQAIPQGATRVRASYVRKKDLEKATTEAEASLGPVSATETKESRRSRRKEQERAELAPVAEKETVQEPIKEPESPAITETAANATPVPDVAVTTKEVEIPKGEVKQEETKESEKKEENKEPEAPQVVEENVKALEPAAITPSVSEPVVVAPIQEPAPTQEEPKATTPEATKVETKELTPEPAVPQTETPVAVANIEPKQEEKPTELPKEEVISTVTPDATVQTSPQPETKTEVPVAPAEAAVVTKEPEAPKPAETAAEEKPKETEAEPADDFSRLKAKLDRVVYASDKAVPAVEAKHEEKVADPVPVAVVPAKAYTVKKGETAYSIAKKNKISVKQLLEWNKLDAPIVKEGMQLRVK